MERRGIKGEKKRRKGEVCREIKRERRGKRKRKKRGRRENPCDCESYIIKSEISDLGVRNKLEELSW